MTRWPANREIPPDMMDKIFNDVFTDIFGRHETFLPILWVNEFEWLENYRIKWIADPYHSGCWDTNRTAYIDDLTPVGLAMKDGYYGS